MPQLLTTKALVQCPHRFPGVTTPSTPQWSIDGGFVLAEGDSGVISCTFPVPCGGYVLKSMGLNATYLMGRRAVLATDFQQTMTGLPLTIQEFHTTYDDSTPAPLPPPGEAQASPSPALLDLVPPVVVSARPSLVYVTSLPESPLSTAFTLATAFPSRWLLILLSEPSALHADITGGVPGLAVVPSEDPWEHPTLTVTLTLTSPFLSSLAPGKHHFFMTGISQRGLSGSFDVVLTVS